MVIGVLMVSAVVGVVITLALLQRSRRQLRKARKTVRLRDAEIAGILAGVEGSLTLRRVAELRPEERITATTSRESSGHDSTGEVHYVRETRFPLLDAARGDRLLGVVTHLRDVSDEHAALAQMDAASGQVHAFLNAAPDATLLVDEAGIIQYANAQVAILLGYFMDELVGSPVALLVAGVEPVRRQLGKAAPITTHHRDGHRIEVDLALSPVSVGSGGPWTLVFLRDATVQLRAEQALRDAQERYRFLAEHDALTGLVNRRRFQSDLDAHLATCRVGGARGALLAIDLDNFKTVNDTLGHHVGDQLVTSVAHALRAAVRHRDVVARQGGDEFLVLLVDASAADAAVAAERLLAAVQEAAQMLPPALVVTASIGIVAFDRIPIGDLTPEHVQVEADVAMYAAKAAGRGCTVAYEAPPLGKRRAG